jgi:hypothetical protein
VSAPRLCAGSGVVLLALCLSQTTARVACTCRPEHPVEPPPEPPPAVNGSHSSVQTRPASNEARLAQGRAKSTIDGWRGLASVGSMVVRLRRRAGRHRLPSRLQREVQSPCSSMWTGCASISCRREARLCPGEDREGDGSWPSALVSGDGIRRRGQPRPAPAPLAAPDDCEGPAGRHRLAQAGRCRHRVGPPDPAPQRRRHPPRGGGRRYSYLTIVSAAGGRSTTLYQAKLDPSGKPSLSPDWKLDGRGAEEHLAVLFTQAPVDDAQLTPLLSRRDGDTWCIHEILPKEFP